VHLAFGGRLRYLVSGAAPLEPGVFERLRSLGFGVHEGYGLTEASPVLTVGWPRYATPPGSVGWPLPGIEVRILDADEAGVGEVIARGPTIMAGYLDAPEETARALQGGWLHTGDRGRLDEDGRLFIVGRDKDTIIDGSGKNVYPDEIEEIYGGHPLVKELSVVGIPAESGPGERVACLVVPDYAAEEATRDQLTPEEVRERVRAHFREVGARLPFARRIKVLHIWDGELPRTSTRKVKRGPVRAELERLERTLVAARGANGEPEAGQDPDALIRRTIAAIARRKVQDVTADARLVDDLGFDSLMQLELLTTLESERPKAAIRAEELATAATVAEVAALARRQSEGEPGRPPEDVAHAEEQGPVTLPKPITALGKTLLGAAQRLTYARLLDVDVEGQGNIPANRSFIVASNHASHLDMGLVKHALGPFGREMRTLAAKDYFFDDPVRRAYFENFTNLLPMDRHGSLKKSLRLAADAIRAGETLLVFPEGTRARDGEMTEFKPAVGYLCLHEKVDILPMWLGGTHEVLPVGAAVPKRRRLRVRIGAPVACDAMLRETKGMSRSQAYRHVTRELERRVRALSGTLDDERADRAEPETASETEGARS
jgi:long-chain acyl-CoA synthetase